MPSWQSSVLLLRLPRQNRQMGRRRQYDVDGRSEMHQQVREFVAGWCGPHYWPRVVEFGSRDVNGTVRDLVPHQTWVGIDRVPGNGVELVMDCRDYYPITQPDLLVCLEVLEHSDDPQAIVEQAGQVLKSGGWLVMTCATDPREPHSAGDGGPLPAGEHYANVALDDFVDWCWWGEVIVSEVDEVAGDLRVIVRKFG